MRQIDIIESLLTHWWYICVSKLTVIASDNDLSPGRRQAIIWTSAGMLLIGPLGTNFSENLIEIITFNSRKCIWKCRLENGDRLVSASMCYRNAVTNPVWPGQYYSPYRKPVIITFLCIPLFVENLLQCQTHNSSGVGKQTPVPGAASQEWKAQILNLIRNYRQLFDIRRTKSQKLNVIRLVLQLYLPNPLEPGVS